MRVFETPELMETIGYYFDATDISRSFLVNSLFRSVLDSDRMWQQHCTALGFRSLSSTTRTRGHVSPKQIYLSNICVECKSVGLRGMVVVNMNSNHSTGSRATLPLVSVCSECVADIQAVSQWSERLKTCLLRARSRLGHNDWFLLLSKIPAAAAAPRTGAAKRSLQSGPRTTAVDFEGAHHNDFLVRKVAKKR